MGIRENGKHAISHRYVKVLTIFFSALLSGINTLYGTIRKYEHGRNVFRDMEFGNILRVQIYHIYQLQPKRTKHKEEDC